MIRLNAAFSGSMCLPSQGMVCLLIRDKDSGSPAVVRCLCWLGLRCLVGIQMVSSCHVFYILEAKVLTVVHVEHGVADSMSRNNLHTLFFIHHSTWARYQGN